MNPEQLRLFAEIEDRHWWFVARRRIIHQLIAEILPADKGKTILDIGCGAGANLGMLAEKYRCVGIDTSPTAVELAQRRFPAARFVCGQAPADVADVIRQADLILMMDVIEHVSDDLLFFSKITAETKAGAHVLVTVPANMGLWSRHDETVLHYRRYDRARFEEVWQGLAFKPRLVSHFNSRLYPCIKLARTIARRRGRSVGRADTDFSMPAPPINRALTRFFEGESRRLRKVLNAPTARVYRKGVSLLAILERLPGVIEPRTKPQRLAPDPYQPAAAES